MRYTLFRYSETDQVQEGHGRSWFRCKRNTLNNLRSGNTGRPSFPDLTIDLAGLEQSWRRNLLPGLHCLPTEPSTLTLQTTMTHLTLDLKTLKTYKNRVIGNPTAKATLAKDEIFIGL